MVRNTATGSLLPDSISSVAPVRRSRCRPPARRRKNTAAASVEATIVPSSSASSGGRASSFEAASAVSTAVIATPALASTSAGNTLPRTCAARVRRPPSNRIIASASAPIRYVSRVSS